MKRAIRDFARDCQYTRKATVEIESGGHIIPIDLLADSVVSEQEVEMHGRYPDHEKMFKALEKARREVKRTSMRILDQMVKQSNNFLISKSFWWLFGSSVVGASAVPYSLALAQKSNLETLAVALSTVGATLLGFVLTAVTILAAAADTRLVSNMYKTGHAQTLLDELFGGVAVFLIVTALAIASLVAKEDWANGLAAAAAMYFVLGTVALITTGRKFYAVMIVLNQVQQQHPSTGHVA